MLRCVIPIKFLINCERGCKRYSHILSLPFKIDKKNVEKILEETKGILEKNTENIKVVAKKSDPIQKKFLPFHSADITNLGSRFVGKYGIDRVEYYTDIVLMNGNITPQTKSRIVTDWYNISGALDPVDYPLGVWNTQIYAGFEYPRNKIEGALRTVDLDQLNQIPSNDIIVSPHEMNMSYALEKIISEVHKLEEDRVKKYIVSKTNADSVELHNVNLLLDSCKIKLHSFHLPAYVHITKNETHELYKVVSGFTGKYDGEIIYSPIKTGALGSITGLAIGGLSFLFKTNPYVALGTVLFRLGLFTGIGGLFSGLWAKYIHENKYYRARSELKEEKEYNSQTEETDDDIRRKNGPNTSHNSSQDSLYPEDECRLLGLNHRKKITLNELRNARFEKLKQWHPDITLGDKKIATEMSVRINEAYEKIFNIVKYQN